MKVTRRWILGFGVGSLGAAALGSFALPFSAASERFMVQRVIYHYAPGIVFEGDDLTEFASYIHRKVLRSKNFGLRKLALYGGTFFPYHTASIKSFLPAVRSISNIDQAIMDKFFLCTDFWSAPPTAGRKISLVRPPDPYEAGCSNPLANLALAPDARST
jgi:hypothetical protein